MGIWGFIGSTTEAVKRNAPDAAPVKDAFTKIDQVVRINWMPDDETKSKIGMFTLKFARNAWLYALREGYKLIPGGVALSKIIKNTVDDVQFENLKSEKLKALEENVGSSKKHLSGSSEIIGRAEKDGEEGAGLISNEELHLGRNMCPPRCRL